MKLIRTKPYKLPSYICLEELETSFSLETKKEFGNKISKKIIQTILKINPNLLNKLKLKKTDDLIVILMKPLDLYKLVPYYFTANKVFLYIYDLWEDQKPFLYKALKKLNITAVFLSSKQTADELNKTWQDITTKFFWIPEAVKLDSYKSYELDKKDIDILSFKRRNNKYHKRILEYSKKNHINYLYQKNNQLLFPDQESFVNGLARAKISICIPANITNPEYAKNISKVTMRYFQSMASKCLILGKSPNDLQYIFNYKPIIEIDDKNPIEQLDEIIINYDKYIPLINKNFEEIKNNQQYYNRINDLLDKIKTFK